jgi:hypothetical protein
MEIGEKEKRLHPLAAARLDGGAEHAHVIAQMRCACGGDAGQNSGGFHKRGVFFTG